MTASAAKPKPVFMRGTGITTPVIEYVSGNVIKVENAEAASEGLIARLSTAGGKSNLMLGTVTDVDINTGLVTTTHAVESEATDAILWVAEHHLQFNSYPTLPYSPIIADYPHVITETMGGYYSRKKLFQARKSIKLSFKRMDETTCTGLVNWYQDSDKADGSLNEFDVCIDSTSQIYTVVFDGPPETFVEYGPSIYSVTLNLIIVETLT